MVMTSGIMRASPHGVGEKKPSYLPCGLCPCKCCDAPPVSGSGLPRHRLGLRGCTLVVHPRVVRALLAMLRPPLAEAAVTAPDRLAETLEPLDPTRELVGHLARLVSIADHV